MFDYHAGFGINPVQMGPMFTTAWVEDAIDQVHNVCCDIVDHEGSRMVTYCDLNDYLQEANLPTYTNLPYNLQQIIQKELFII